CGHWVHTASSSSAAALCPSTMPMTLWVALESSQDTVGLAGIEPSSGAYWVESTQSPTAIALIASWAWLLRTTMIAIAATATATITAPDTTHFHTPPARPLTGSAADGFSAGAALSPAPTPIS